MKRLFLFLLLLNSWPPCQADIYKYTDANGVVTYTNVKPAGARNSEVIISGPKTSTTDSILQEKRPSAKTPSPAAFPKVDQTTQMQRDNKRKDILMSELAQEKQALESAVSQYEEAKNTPEVYRNAKGKTFRNVAKYDEKLRAFEAEIQAHERNIDLLNKELNH